MKTELIKTYNWIEDFGPAILKNLNELLVAEGTDPISQLHGGSFKDGKWVDVLKSDDYRNYWHVYLALFGDDLRNDSYQRVYFPHYNDAEQWGYISDRAEESTSGKNYKHSDPKWARNLVTALRKTLEENIEPDDADGYRIVFWWCW